jgi:transcriptional regulator with XRE-family HTH domain
MRNLSKVQKMNEERDKNRLQEIGEHLRKIREKEVKISLDELASRCDVTKGNISNIENGKKDFTFTTFLEIAKGLKVHPKHLLDHNFKFLKED